MRKLTVVLTAVSGLTACGGTAGWQPVSLTGPSRATGDAAAECVRNELRDMGYEVTGTSPGAMSITGIRRNEVAWYYRLLPGGVDPSVDQLDVRLDQGQLRVTAHSTTNITERQPAPGELASPAARSNAEQLLRECGRSS